MMASLTEMTAADLLKYFLAAIGALGGVIAFMGRWILSEVKALKASHSELERKLESEIKERVKTPTERFTALDKLRTSAPTAVNQNVWNRFVRPAPPAQFPKVSSAETGFGRVPPLFR